MNCLVYIIVPVYNVERYIGRCIDSILLQSYRNFKLLLIDDGSTDASRDICQNYSLIDERITLIHQANKGPSSARNKGLDLVKYEDTLITFIDGDDFVEKDYLLNLTNIMNVYDADVVCSSFFFYTNNKEYVQKTPICKVLDSYTSLVKLFEDREINSMVHHKIYKSFLWEKIRFPEHLFFLEDTAVLYKVFLLSNIIVLSSYCGYFYNQDNAFSIMRKPITNQKILSGWESIRSVYQYDFFEFGDRKRKIIHQKVLNLFMDNFLELYPRFNINQDKEQLALFLKYIKKNKFAFKFKPKTIKQFAKKTLFMVFPSLYRLIFKAYIYLFK